MSRPKFVDFDGMRFPTPDGDLEWTLRYGKPTKPQLLMAAWILESYQGLIERKSLKASRYAISQIRKKLREEKG